MSKLNLNFLKFRLPAIEYQFIENENEDFMLNSNVNYIQQEHLKVIFMIKNLREWNEFMFHNITKFLIKKEDTSILFYNQ